MTYFESSGLAAIRRIDLATCRAAVLAGHPEWNLYLGRYSPDGSWMVMQAKTRPDRSRLFLVPVRRDGQSVPPSEWIAASEGTAYDGPARFSPDGNWVYFLSDRDGFHCLWAQRLNHVTMRPVGEPRAVHHFHAATFQPPTMLWVARDKVVFSIKELTGNVWLAR